jgi:hypothetical protein
MKLSDVWKEWNALSAFATSIAAMGGVVYTYFTLRILIQSKRAIQGDMYLKLKDTMTNEALILTSTYSYADTIKIVDDNSINSPSGFLITENILMINKNCFMKKVLGNLEDLALLNEQNILSLDFIDAGYGYQILQIGNNTEVKRVINDLRGNYPGTYEGINALYSSIWLKLKRHQRSDYSKSIF